MYFGLREVKSFDILDKEPFVNVVYVDGGHESMSVEEWEACKSEEQGKEDYDFDRKRLGKASDGVLKVLQEQNVRIEDMGFVFSMVRDAVQMAVNKGKEIAFGQPAWTLRLKDVEDMMEKAKKDGREAKFTSVLRKVQGGVVDI